MPDRPAGPRRHSPSATRDGEPKVHPSAQLRAATLGRFCEIKERVQFAESSLGDYSYIERHSEAIYTRIGKFSAIASDVRLNALAHPIERVSQHKITYRANEYFVGEKLDADFRALRQTRMVEVGHDVWIGHGAIVLPGVKIGDGAVVGAGAVVTENVEPYAIVAGVPARFLKWRFEPDLARRVRALGWWDWEHDKLAQTIADMQVLDAAELVAKYGG